VCPVTGQPDFATIQYIPDRCILESKSLKLYLWSYREKGVFHEHVTNQILDDLVEALDPLYCDVTLERSTYEAEFPSQLRPSTRNLKGTERRTTAGESVLLLPVRSAHI